MRGIRGWIKNLYDGKGPPPGTVDVHAVPRSTGEQELNETTHTLGKLVQLHLTGSSSITKADQIGHFGWDMELNPGLMDITLLATDPSPAQHRARFPDESAQIGKAFITDLERLGWAGGKDHLIWDAVYGGHQPTAAQWNNDPTLSALLGNWSCGGVGTGSNSGRVIVRRGIAMLGGVVFSVEMGDLMVPVAGRPAASPNGTGQDRWDVVYLTINWNSDPGNMEYGKQDIEIREGSPGGGVGLPIGNSGNYRRLPLWAIRMPANQAIYDGTNTGLIDLRRWDSVPAVTSVGQVYTFLPAGNNLPVGTPAPPTSLPGWETIANWVNAGISTSLGTTPFTLPTGCAWDGHGVATFQVYFSESQTQLPGPFVAWIWTESQDTKAEWKNDDYVIKPPNSVEPSSGATPTSANLAWARWEFLGGVPPAGMAMLSTIDIPFTMRRIPAYHIDAIGAGGRSWSKLKFRIMIGSLNGYLYVRQQDFVCTFVPVS